MVSELEIIAKLINLCCALCCFPTDFTSNPNLLKVTKSKWKVYFVIIQILFSALYCGYALIQLGFVLKSAGQLNYIIFHVIMIFVQFLSTVIPWTSYRYTEELTEIFTFLMNFEKFNSEFIIPTNFKISLVEIIKRIEMNGVYLR